MNSVKKPSIWKRIIITACINIAGIFISFVAIWLFIITALGQYIHHERRKPREDSVYIGYLGFYARDSLPSAKVVQKDYLEGEYSSAVFRVDSIDFVKVLKGVQNCEHLSKDTIVKFNKSAIEILQKENIDVTTLDYQYKCFSINCIGFKCPDLIVFDKTLYD